MKKISILLFVSVFIAGIQSNAQKGWQWGEGARMVPNVGAAAGNNLMEGMAVAVDASGNSYGSCLIYGTDTCFFGSIAVTNPGHRIFMTISKTDPAGHTLWVLKSGASPFVAEGESMVTDRAGNLYVLCVYQAPSMTIGSATVTAPLPSGSTMYALLKVAPSGNVIWLKNLCPQASNMSHYGQISIDGADRITVAGGFSAASVTIGPSTLVNGDPSGFSQNIFIARLDTSGTPHWARSLKSRRGIDLGRFAVTRSGNMYFCGGFLDTLSEGSGFLFNSLSNAIPFLIKLDTAANWVWGQSNPSITMHYSSVAADTADGAYLTGYFSGTATVGSTTFIPPGSLLGLLAARIDTGGAIVWAKAGFGGAAGKDIQVDLCGNIVIFGKADAVLPTTFGTDTFYAPVSSADPLFAMQLDPAGNFVSGSALASGSEDFSGMAIDNKGSVFICADYAINMNVGKDTLSAITTNVDEVFFVAKYNYDTVLCPAEKKLKVGVDDIDLGGVRVYPNPASVSFFISSAKPFAHGCTAELFDLTGKHIATYVLAGTSVEVYTGTLPRGLYLCRIKDSDGEVYVRKIAIN